MTREDELRRIAAYEPTDEESAAWDSWVAERPERVRVVAAKLKPWRAYVLKTTGAIVVLHAVDEPEDPNEPITLRVDVTRALNEHVMFDRTVFGIRPEDVVEWTPRSN